MMLEDVKWSKFAAGLYSYISAGRSRLIKTNYDVKINMSDGDILHELQICTKIEQLSPELQRVAKEYNKWARVDIDGGENQET